MSDLLESNKKPKTPEHRKKISLSMKKRWAEAKKKYEENQQQQKSPQ